MWYRISQNNPPLNKGGYPFIMPSGKKLPWHENIQLDKSKYSQKFLDWVQSQLHPSKDGAGEGGVKNWSAVRGGLTNKGITQSEYDLFRKSQNKQPQTVKNITADEINQILHRNYWARLNLEKMPEMVAVVIGTFGLLRGAEEAANALQKHLQAKNSKQPITGNIYQTTLQNLLNAANTKEQEYKIAIKMLDELSSRLDPRLGGYKKRMEYLKTLVDKMYQKSKTPKQVSEAKEEINIELQNLSSSMENLNVNNTGQPTA